MAGERQFCHATASLTPRRKVDRRPVRRAAASWAGAASSPSTSSQNAGESHPAGDLGTDVGALIEPLAVTCHAVRLSGAPLERSAAFGADPIRVAATAALTVVGVARQPVVEPAEGREGGARSPVLTPHHQKRGCDQIVAARTRLATPRPWRDLPASAPACLRCLELDASGAASGRLQEKRSWTTAGETGERRPGSVALTCKEPLALLLLSIKASPHAAWHAAAQLHAVKTLADDAPSSNPVPPAASSDRKRRHRSLAAGTDVRAGRDVICGSRRVAPRQGSVGRPRTLGRRGTVFR
jgi:hypothetical protein